MSQSKEQAIDRLSLLLFLAGGAFAGSVVLHDNYSSASPASTLARGNATVFSPAHHERWHSRPLTLSLSKGVSGGECAHSLPAHMVRQAHHERAREAERAGEGRAPSHFRHSSGSGSPSPTTGSGPLRRRAKRRAPIVILNGAQSFGWAQDELREESRAFARGSVTHHTRSLGFFAALRMTESRHSRRSLPVGASPVGARSDGTPAGHRATTRVAPTTGSIMSAPATRSCPMCRRAERRAPIVIAAQAEAQHHRHSERSAAESRNLGLSQRLRRPTEERNALPVSNQPRPASVLDFSAPLEMTGVGGRNRRHRHSRGSGDKRAHRLPAPPPSFLRKQESIPPLSLQVLDPRFRGGDGSETSPPPPRLAHLTPAQMVRQAHHERWLSRPLTLSLSKGVSGGKCARSLPAQVVRQAHHERAREAERAREGKPNGPRQLSFLYVPANSLTDTQ